MLALAHQKWEKNGGKSIIIENIYTKNQKQCYLNWLKLGHNFTIID